eukprot:6460920-Amphidinium_carterae.2
MGWSHALWACQVMHESIVRVGNVGMHNLLVDNRIAPRLDPFVHTQYVDNFICLSQSERVGRKVAEDADSRLRARGLPTHGVEVSTGGTTLGWTFDSEQPMVYVSRASAWRLIFALEELARRGRASGRELSVVIGHYTMRSLIRRELLSVFFTTYGYIQAFPSVVADLWPSMKDELLLGAALIPLAFRDLCAGMCEEVSVFDASSWGAGVLTKQIPREVAERCCAFNDRWRFSRRGEEEVGKPRESMSHEAEPGVETVIEQIPSSVWAGQWKRAVRKRWTREEPQAILEARAGDRWSHRSTPFVEM